MQIHHESQLIEPSPINGKDIVSNYSQALDEYTLHQTNFNSIEQLASSNSAQGSSILAVYSGCSNHISLIDSRHSTRRSRFSLKSCDKRYSRHSFVLKGMDFSPDGSRLAIGQSDCIIYIYKVGQQNDVSGSTDNNQSALSRPVISGKFVCSNPVTCLTWTEVGIIFGTKDGKLKLISHSVGPKQSGLANDFQQSVQTRVINLYSSPKGTMPITLASKLPVIAVGFVDGSLQIFTDHDVSFLLSEGSRRNSSYQNQTSPLTIDHGRAPYRLSLLQNNQLCCADSGGQLTFYTIDLEQRKWSSQVISVKDEIISIDYSITNDMIALATRNRLLFVVLNADTNKWQLQASFIEFQSSAIDMTLTCLSWICDGSQLAVGTQCGSLELFRCSWNKQSLNDRLDICLIAKNRVRITDRERNLLATYKTSFDIKRVNLFDEGQNVLIWTTGSLLMAQLGASQSEIKWRRDREASKFYFHPAGYVIIFTPSMWELLIIKLGNDSILFSTKLDSQVLNKDLISLSCFPHGQQSDDYPLSTVAGSITKFYPTYSKVMSEATNNANLESGDQADNSSLTVLGDDEAGKNQSAKRANRGTTRLPVVEWLAYVSDSGQQLSLIDLRTGTRKTIVKVSESKTIVWINLSCSGKHLAWKNSDNRLNLMQISSSNGDVNYESKIKLDQVSYCCWIPETDILVAQSLHKIYIWYKIEQFHNPKVIDSRGYNILKRTPIIDLSYSTQSIIGSDRSVKAYPEVSRLTSNEICLTNGCSIPLDSLFIRFHREMIQLKLDSALGLLEKERGQELRIDLWTELGWIAIKEEDLAIAIRAFKEIDHTTMVDYLKACSSLDQLDELRSRLAKLNGDWDLFERLQEPEVVVSTYKRLNKWSRCVEFLAKTEQYRQKDLAEQEFRKWLLNQGRHLEAAKLQAKQTGDLEGAIELLIERNNLEDAARLLLDEHKVAVTSCFKSNNLIPNRLKEKLVSDGSYKLAAKVSEVILNQPMDALDLFLRGEHYEEALLLATNDEQVRRIKKDLGSKLLADFRQNITTKAKATRSIQLYLEAGALVEALEAAIELGESEKGLEILLETNGSNNDHLDEDQICEYCDKIASKLLMDNRRSLAIKAYELGKHYSKVIELALEEKKFDEAFRVSLKYIYNGDKQATKEEFKRLAKEKIDHDNDWQSAEQLYLLIGETDSAIEMHELKGNHQRLMEIVEQYQPESRERYLLLLAKKMEQEGKFEDAERLLLKVGQEEWTNVVRMYRLANKWDEAYRVARDHCQSNKDPLLVQLAYFWAKSELTAASSVDKTRTLLEKQLDCFQEVLEFSCINNNYAFAIELCGLDLDEKIRIVKKYANYLEKNQNLAKAEEILVKYNQYEDAAKMYLDNDLYPDAIRLIEEAQQSHTNTNDQQMQRKLIELLNRTLVESANRIAGQIQVTGRGINLNEATNDGKQLAIAQQMYLRAQKPELAIEMYKSRQQWREAVQLAQRFAPQLLESIENDLDVQAHLDLEPIIHDNSSLAKQNNHTSNKISSRPSILTTAFDGEEDGNQSSAADQFFHLRAEQSIRRSNDTRGTQLALGRLMSNLAEGDFQNDASCLILSEKVALFEHCPTYDRETLQKIGLLSDQLFQVSCPLIGDLTLEHISVWRKFRDLLADILMSINKKEDDQVSIIFEQKLLALHYVILHRCLSRRIFTISGELPRSQSQILGPFSAKKLRAKLKTATSQQQQHMASILSLVSKLSMSLLRYSDMLDARATFLSAGFWTLVAGRDSFARFAWSRLIELIDASGRNRLERQLKQADCPTATNNSSSSIVSSKYQSLGEIRSWLMESLLDNRASTELSPLDEDGQSESSLRNGMFRPCLVSGYPILQQVSSYWAVRETEWKTLTMLATEESTSNNNLPNKTTKQLNVVECLEFIKLLMGKTIES